MNKEKYYYLASLPVSAVIAVMIAWHADGITYASENNPQTSVQETSTQVETTSLEQTNLQDTASADTAAMTDGSSAETTTSDTGATDLQSTSRMTTAVSNIQQTVPEPTMKLGNSRIYDVSTPTDMYGADEETTSQIQLVAPESSFQVTYVQDNRDLVSKMTDVLTSLGTDTIREYSADLSVYITLPSDIDISGMDRSSFILEGYYALFDIVNLDIEQAESFTLITLEFSAKTNYSSIESLLNDYQENAVGKITLSGLSVPSSYSLGDVFYINSLPQGTVNVTVNDMKYQFEAIPSISYGNDGETKTFIDPQTDGLLPHVTFKVGISDPENTADSEDTADSENTAIDIENTTTDIMISEHTEEAASKEKTTEFVDRQAPKAVSAAVHETSDIQTGSETHIFGWLVVLVLSIGALFSRHLKIEKR